MSPWNMVWLGALIASAPLLGGCASSPSAPVVAPSAPPPAVAPAPSASAPVAPVPAPAPPPTPTDEQLIERYTPVWRTLLARHNGVTPDVVERGIPRSFRSIKHTSSGTYLVVNYLFALSWATTYVEDAVLVRVDARDSYASWFGSKVDRWLSAAEVELVAFAPPDPTTLARLPLGQRLKYPSWTAALAALPGDTGVTFDDDTVNLELAGPRDVGTIFLNGKILLPGKGQHCVRARLDLVTGQAVRSRDDCGLVF